MQLAACRGVDAELVRALIHFPTMPRQLENMTLATPHDLAIMSLKGAHYASRAHHLGEAETEVSRRVNFPRRMAEDLRHLVILKLIKVRFHDTQSKSDLIDATRQIVERQFH